MSSRVEKMFEYQSKREERVKELFDKLFSVAQPGSVYSQPLTAGDYTVITASEVVAGAGFGFGLGGGVASKEAKEAKETKEGGEGQEAPEKPEDNETLGGGGGGGGGGNSMARPVAVISVGPEGVEVKPVVDSTKVALALFTTLGAMFVMGGRMTRMSRKLRG